MFERGILPELKRRSGDPSVIASRILLTWGESESGLNERLDDVIAELETVGEPDAGVPGQRLERAQGSSHCQGGRCRRRAGCCSTSGRRGFGRRSTTSCSVSTATRWSRSCSICCAGASGRIGLAESVTGGLVGARLTVDPRSERCVPWLDRVVRDRGETAGARRAATARSCPRRPRSTMARGARRVLGADVGLALTGVAGPAEQDGMPAGTLCVGLVWPDGELGAHRSGCRGSVSRCVSSR